MNFASRFSHNLLFTVEGGYVRDPVLSPVPVGDLRNMPRCQPSSKIQFRYSTDCSSLYSKECTVYTDILDFL